MKVGILFDNYGPYHFERVRSLSVHFDVFAYELYGLSDEYSWKRVHRKGFEFKTICETRKVSCFKLVVSIHKAIAFQKLDALLIPGYNFLYLYFILILCKIYRVKTILMSESQKDDFIRNPFKEKFKSVILQLFDGAIVGGKSHSDYLKELHFTKPIEFGYDVVDIEHFKTAAEVCRKYSDGITFLTVSRFLPKKNLFRMADAMHKVVANSQLPVRWIIAGDGPLQADFERYVKGKGCSFIEILGFVQYEEIVGYFKRSHALFHGSVSEQWGLVINEAMASGLAIVGSSKTGAVRELVSVPTHGFTFDPYSVDEMEFALDQFVKLSVNEKLEISQNVQMAISEHGIEKFGLAVKGLLNEN